MERPLRKTLTCLIIFSIALFVSPLGAIADDPSPAPSAPASKPPSDLAKRVQEITDAVLENHIDPPARQQMILSGIKALYRTDGMPIPRGLGGRVSAVATPEQLAALLAEAWPKTTAKSVAVKTLEEALLNGLLAVVPGGAELMTAKDRKVWEQIEGNRYVGIHIALGMDDKEKRPVLINVLEGGPADRAGVKQNDLIEEIDGLDTKDMRLRDVVDRLRGEEGTDVTIKVRQPNETKSRTITITRGQLPHATIEGVRKWPDGVWDVRPDGLHDPIGYLKITEIGGSTPHELRKMAQQLETQGARALILDLRGSKRTSAVHPAVLLADCLLDHGPIGRVRTAQGETTYQADSDALFRGWPIAVLVDANTSGTAEWLAAALQDNHRATIVGTPTHGAMRARTAGGPMPQETPGVRSRVSVGDGSWSIELTTGSLARGDGRALSDPDEDATDTSRDLTFRRAKPEEIKTGVKPDHVIAAKPGLADRLRARSQEPAGIKVQEKAPQAVFSNDPSIDKAIQVLRGSLKTH
jgi:carboxyl-terminal processing protease